VGQLIGGAFLNGPSSLAGDASEETADVKFGDFVIRERFRPLTGPLSYANANLWHRRRLAALCVRSGGFGLGAYLSVRKALHASRETWLQGLLLCASSAGARDEVFYGSGCGMTPLS
jgi:hypothetical protein